MKSQFSSTPHGISIEQFIARADMWLGGGEEIEGFLQELGGDGRPGDDKRVEKIAGAGNVEDELGNRLRNGFGGLGTAGLGTSSRSVSKQVFSPLITFGLIITSTCRWARISAPSRSWLRRSLHL